VIGFLRRLSDDRYRRAERRRRTEEIMGWVCVPVIVVVAWFAWQAWEDVNKGRASAPEPVIPSTLTIRRN
jgi:hypothetical protein